MKRIALAITLAVVFGFGYSAKTQVTSPYERLDWHCAGWEADWKVGLGNDPNIVLFAEKPETTTSDRKVCFATKPTE